MKEIKNYNINELIDRLLYNCLDVRIDNNKLIIKSYPHREGSSSIYRGDAEEYCYELGDIKQIQDIIVNAYATYDKYIQEYVEKTVKKFIRLQ